MKGIISIIISFLILRFFFKSAGFLFKLAITIALIFLFLKFKDIIWIH